MSGPDGELRLIATFATTHSAISMERLCRAQGLPGRLIPVPRSISASCGMAWCALPEEREVLEGAVPSDPAIRVEGWSYVMF